MWSGAGTDVAELFWEEEAGATYDRLREDPSRLLDAVDEVLDQLEDDPGSDRVRRRQRRTRSRRAIWKVDIRPHSDDWTLLWVEHPERPDDVLILFLGPAGYTP